MLIRLTRLHIDTLCFPSGSSMGWSNNYTLPHVVSPTFCLLQTVIMRDQGQDVFSCVSRRGRDRVDVRSLHNGQRRHLNCDPGVVTINSLPDNILLNIFGLYREDFMNYMGPRCTWHRLTHVCRRWRHVVFASPIQLDLRIVCTERTPVMELLDIWPPLPIITKYWLYSASTSNFSVPDAITALAHHHRVCQIQLSHLTQPLLDMLAIAMQEQYPALTVLELCSDEEIAPVLPDTFLGGSAPRLRSLSLEGIAFPALPRLLLSAVGLVSLLLDKIPQNTGYISPDVMATSLSTLTRLRFLRIDFRSPALPPNIRQFPRQSTRTVLPCLAWLEFRGVNGYLEDLMARIEAPFLDNINIKFFNQPVFVIPQLPQFIARSEKFKLPHQATIIFQSDFVQITVSPPRGTVGCLTFQVLCTVPLRQVSAMVQICNQALSLLSNVEWLEVCGGECEHSLQDWQAVKSDQWLELFEPFVGVECLHVTKYLGSLTASALREAGGRRRATEVLPALRSVFLEELEPSDSAISRPVTARGPSGRPVKVCSRRSEWEHDLGWEQFLEVDD
jgi:hypothetical protein